MRDIKIELHHFHLTLTRYTTGEQISVTLTSTGYVMDAHCEATGLAAELTDDEIRYVLYSLNIDPD